MTSPLRDWQHTFGGSSNDNSTKVINDGNGGYWILGNSDSNNGDLISNAGLTDLFLINTDAVGNCIRKFSLGGNGIDIGTGLIQYNGNLIISGYTSSSNFPGTTSFGSYDGFLLCVDTSGSIVWSKRYGGAGADLIYTVIQVPGGFALGGGSYSNLTNNPNHGDQDVWVIKTDYNGTLLWQSLKGGSAFDVCYGLIYTNGDLYATGGTGSINQDVSFNHGSYDVWLLNFDCTTGSLMWEKTYGGTLNDLALCSQLTASGQIMFGGYSRSSNGDLTGNYGFADAWVGFCDLNGNLLSQKNFGGSGSDAIYSMDETFDGYIISAGTTSADNDVPSNNGMEDVWVFKIDAGFNKLWSKTLGGTQNDRPASLLSYSNGQITICGYSFSSDGDVTLNRGSSDVWNVHMSCLLPSMNITTSQANSCYGDTITLISQSMNFARHQWFFNSTLVSANDTLRLNVQSPGNYTVSLLGETCYNSDSTSLPLLVDNCYAPAADFANDVNQVCAGGNIQFIDQSHLATSWQWQFPGGFPSSSQDENPVINYSTPGVYSVLLTAINVFGTQSLMRQNYITVNALPAVSVINATGNLLQVNVPGSSVQWYFNSSVIVSATDQTYAATLDGFYEAYITDVNGCSIFSDSIYLDATKIDGLSVSSIFEVYPNPVKDELHFYAASAEANIQLFNAVGEKLFETSDVLISVISMRDYAPGEYLLIYRSKNTNVYKKIIKF